MANKKKNNKQKTENVKAKGTEQTQEETTSTNASQENESTMENDSNEEAKNDEPDKDVKEETLVKDPKDEKIEELEDRFKRQLAEFDNYRKRTDKEKEQMFETGAKSVIEKIIPIVDNFERGIDNIKEEDEGNPHAEGMKMIYKQLMTELEKLEVKPIEAVGKEFNPDFHNAIMQTESEEYESGIVAQEFQKGYTYRDSVIRHSMVSVVQ